MKPVLHFAGVILAVTIALVALGALLGAVLWPLVGWLAGTQRTLGQLAFAGARDLGFYFFVWAPGVAIVVATMREHRRRQDARREHSRPTAV